MQTMRMRMRKRKRGDQGRDPGLSRSVERASGVLIPICSIVLVSMTGLVYQAVCKSFAELVPDGDW